MDVTNYEYGVQTWGGFYNFHNFKVHGQMSGYTYFNSNKDRESYIDNLQKIADELKETGVKDAIIAMNKFEGYDCRTLTVMHRVCRFRGDERYDTEEAHPHYDYDVAKYHMKWKWYPGFNSYPFGEDFDYDQEGFEIVQEWITGAFIQEIPKR